MKNVKRMIIIIGLIIVSGWLVYQGFESKSENRDIGARIPVCHVQGYDYYSHDPREENWIDQLSERFTYYGNIDKIIDVDDEIIDLSCRGITYFNREVYYDKDNSDYIFIRVSLDKYQLLYHEDHTEEEISCFLETVKNNN